MKVLCNLNLFALEQTVYLINDMGTVSPIAIAEMEQLPEVIAAVCSEYGAHRVVLSGNVAYSQSLAEDIKQFGLTNYSDNNIEVEVI